MVPPKELFQAEALPAMPHHEIGQSQVTTPTTRIDFPEEGGVHVYHEGDRYPMKGWPFKEAIFACDCIKRGTMQVVRFILSVPFVYLASILFGIFFMLPDSAKRRIMHAGLVEFVGFSDTVFDRWGRIMPLEDERGVPIGLQGMFWKPEFYCDMVREVRRVGMDLAGKDYFAQRFVEAVCMVLEFDDAYRYRIQDLAESLDRSAFITNPAQETSRLLRLAILRGPSTATKFEPFLRILPVLFRIRAIRETVVAFIEQTDLEKLYLDHIDWYRCLIWNGWDFGGLGLQDRVSARIMVDAEWMHSDPTVKHFKVEPIPV